MQAFQAALRPSHYLCSANLVLHGTAGWLAWVYFYSWPRWLLCIGLLCSLLWAWHQQCRRHADTVLRIDVDAHGRAAVLTGNGVAYAATLQPGSLVLRHALVLHWDIGDRRVRHWVSADMTDAEAFRRLKVWARWAQEPPEAA